MEFADSLSRDFLPKKKEGGETKRRPRGRIQFRVSNFGITISPKFVHGKQKKRKGRCSSVCVSAAAFAKKKRSAKSRKNFFAAKKYFFPAKKKLTRNFFPTEFWGLGWKWELFYRPCQRGGGGGGASSSALWQGEMTNTICCIFFVFFVYVK